MAAIWLTDNGSNMVAAFKDQITGKVGVESVDDDEHSSNLIKSFFNTTIKAFDFNAKLFTVWHFVSWI